MTRLEKIIEQQTKTSLEVTVARMTDRIADRMAEELLNDVSTRAKFLALVRAALLTATAGSGHPPETPAPARE